MKTIGMGLLLGLAMLLTLASLPMAARAQGATTLHVWYASDDAVEQGWFRELVGRYMEAHPGVRIEVLFQGNRELSRNMILALSAGALPDMAYMYRRLTGFPALQEPGGLLDLTAAARERAWDQRLRPGVLEDFNRTYGDRVVAVPYALNHVAVLYNRKLWDERGLQVPRTLDAFEAILERAQAAGLTPLEFGNADFWPADTWYLTLVSALAPVEELEPAMDGAPGFSYERPEMVRAAALLQRWAQSGSFTRGYDALEPEEAVDLFFRGRTLMTLAPSMLSSLILENQLATGIEVGVFAFPRAEDGEVPVALDGGHHGWVIPASSRNQDAAIDFLDYLLSPEAGSLMLSRGALPAHRLEEPEPVAAFQAEWLHLLEETERGLRLDYAPVRGFNEVMEGQLQVLMAGMIPPEELARRLQTAYDAAERVR
ncbi:ABC transporter substrate-binding protein [Limnochorda pilosa]|uniref:ABC transporter substrate-binding protein n=1 Tax=Limnochorda pilosa TaxID=1555112 RepID=A0A0K2SHW4_LIMPI|nr:extracellular solute-binding protein [Limnochorda pilosa]BAS26706.1 hypothetical protein LIP_0849 [Limnochorda pilosa]